MSAYPIPEVSRKIMEIKSKLTSLFVEKDVEINAVLAGLLTREPVILVGAPGTAKTMLIETLARMINAKSFTYLLTRFTEPDELFGIIDVKSLREGTYRRITENTIVDAEIVFLDEIFKASSAIRNTLLRILNEKQYVFGSQVIPVNWLGFYTASNEISTDEEDWAFYDRLVIRVFTKYVSDTSLELLIIKGIELDNGIEIPTIMTKEEVIKLQQLTKQRFYNIKNSRELVNKYIEAVVELKSRGIELSDRRKIKALKVASAISIIYGNTEVTLDDLADALRLVAIHSEDDIPKVEEVINKVGLSQLGKLTQEIEMLIQELNNITTRISTTESLQEFKELVKAGKTIIQELQGKLEKLAKSSNPRVQQYIPRIKEAIAGFKKEVQKIMENFYE